jgi:hypothetical protein
MPHLVFSRKRTRQPERLSGQLEANASASVGLEAHNYTAICTLSEHESALFVVPDLRVGNTHNFLSPLISFPFCDLEHPICLAS